jgi:hypothetical protein
MWFQDLLTCRFELTPTLALNNPLLNPVHTHDSNYFPPAPMMSHASLSSPHVDMSLTIFSERAQS